MIKMPKLLIKILMPVMERLTPTCEVATQKISQSMDQPLSLSDRIRVRLHLMGCELCARYEEQLLAIRKMIGLHSEEISKADSGIKLSETARQRIKKEIRRNQHV
jgi:hypothetical protein